MKIGILLLASDLITTSAGWGSPPIDSPNSPTQAPNHENNPEATASPIESIASPIESTETPTEAPTSVESLYILEPASTNHTDNDMSQHSAISEAQTDHQVEPTPAPGPSTIVTELRTATTFPVGINPLDLAFVDLNVDGKKDIVTINSGSGSISVLLGKGNGMFSPAINFQVGVMPHVIKFEDLNGDGMPDIVTVHSKSNSISVLLGDGNGGFSSVEDFIANI